jgi:SecD/SecF fusion protein
VERADFLTALKTLEEPQFEGKSSFASSVADDMKLSAIQAIILSMIGMVVYLWFRFENINFGVAAVISLVHDVLAVVAVMSLVSYAASEWNITALGIEDFKINLPIIAALMTLVGYSVNDTIVMFDRIREVRGKNPALTEEMVDISINQTLSRTILTAWTVWIVVVVLYFIGGPGIHGFAFSLVIGVIVGTYSSIYISCPFLLYMFNRGNKAQKPKVESQPTKAAAGS